MRKKSDAVDTEGEEGALHCLVLSEDIRYSDSTVITAVP